MEVNQLLQPSSNDSNAQVKGWDSHGHSTHELNSLHLLACTLDSIHAGVRGVSQSHLNQWR
jgi:hypothetical protein